VHGRSHLVVVFSDDCKVGGFSVCHHVAGALERFKSLIGLICLDVLETQLLLQRSYLLLVLGPFIPVEARRPLAYEVQYCFDTEGKGNNCTHSIVLKACVFASGGLVFNDCDLVHG